MTTFTFYPTDGGEYDGHDGAALEAHTGSGNAYIQGTSPDNDLSLMIFNSNAIRTALQGYNITGCTLDFTLNSTGGASPCNIFFGTHNYTSVPSSVAFSRTNRDRVQVAIRGTGRVTGVNLGTTIGAELRDGVSAGLVLGPLPSGYSLSANMAQIAPQDAGSTNRPVLTITAVLANTAPNAPTLNTPGAGSVLDASQGLSFNWTHSDPQGDAMAAFYFRRKHADGTYDWWTGSGWSATETRLTTATVPLTNGVMTIPANQWANGLNWSWSVATEDPGGLKGPYASDRVLYTSAPPMAMVTTPADSSRIASSRPVITWTFSDPDGNPQYGWAAQIVPESTYMEAGFNPDNYLGTAWSASGTGTQTSVTPTKDLLNHTTYRAYVRVSSSPNPSGNLQFSPWAYVEFDVVIPPYPPQMVSPQNGSIADLATTGFTLLWANSFFSGIGMQTAFAIRRLNNASGSQYEWWNGAAWGPTEIFLQGTAPQFTFRAHEVANGATYSFSTAIIDDYNQVSPYAQANTVTAATVAQVTLIAPVGVTVTTRPVVTWTMYQAENDPQQTYRVIVVNAADVVMPTTGPFDPTTVTAVWDTGEVSDQYARNVQVGVDLLNNTNYAVYVRLKSGGLYTSWAYQNFNIFLVPPGAPTVTTVVHDDTGIIDVVVQGRDSMLSDTASRNADDWMAMEDVGNPTVVNGVFYSSAESHLATRVTSTAQGSMMAHNMDAWPVKAGHQYTAAATMIADNGMTPVPAYAVIHWFDANNDLIATQYGQIFVDDAAVRSLVSAIAPPGATSARMGVQFQNVPGAGQSHLIFDPVLRPGGGGEWSPGGLLTNTTVTVTEATTGRALRFGTNVPVPTDTQEVTVLDEEAAIGVAQMYQAVTRAVYPNATLANQSEPSDPATWTSGFLWLSDPVRPGTGLMLNPQKFSPITRPVRQGKFRPLGRPDAVIVTGTRGLREGGFTIVTYSRAEREAFIDLIENSELILIRMPPDQFEDFADAIYIRIDGDAPTTRALDSRTPHRTIAQNWTEQLRPLDFIDYNDPVTQNAAPTPSPMVM